MAFDFVEIKGALGGLTRRFHHQNINEISPFDTLSPTTEHLARWFCEELQRRLVGAPLVGVTVWEGPDCSATYRP
jgi:6-pyruvoyltetrahydropterin/6-carboxytetrahydropterin synthase